VSIITHFPWHNISQTDAFPHFEVEIVDQPLAEGPQQSELARFRQWSFQPHTPALRIHESHDFWDIAIIAKARDMSHFREGLALAPKAEVGHLYTIFPYLLKLSSQTVVMTGAMIPKLP
jgi:hypothetical protein